MIIIVDYGMGNLGSVLNMFKKIGANTKISSDLNEIEQADKILLPGVGAFDHAMQRIEEANMLTVLNQKALVHKVPVLGICLGMQLLTDGSEEGALPGLGWIPAKTLSFKNQLEKDRLMGFRIPHMGWNTTTINNENPLSSNFTIESRFYFVHSYFVQCSNPSDSWLKANYGFEFDAAVHKDNIYGTQFHPEKSHKYGMKLLDNFNQLK